MTPDPHRDLALRLWRARRGGTVIEPPSALDEAAAYRVQEALLREAGEVPAGWKVGATGAGAPAALGLSGPLAGPLWSAFVHLEPAPEVPLPARHRGQAEVEIAFRLAEPPHAASREAIVDAIDGAALAIEITGARLDPATVPPGPGFVADHGGNGAAIVGAFAPIGDGGWLPEVEASMTVGGTHAGRGTGRTVMGDPVAALVWLACHLDARGHAFMAGQVVLSGAIVPLTIIPPGAVIEGRADGFAPVRARIVAA